MVNVMKVKLALPLVTGSHVIASHHFCQGAEHLCQRENVIDASRLRGFRTFVSIFSPEQCQELLLVGISICPYFVTYVLNSYVDWGFCLELA